MTLSLLVFTTSINALLIGLIPTLVDGVQRQIEARLQLVPRRTEWFSRLFYAAWLPGMPLAGWLLDSWPNREILFIGLVALIVAFAWLALVRTLPSLFLNAVALGLAYSFVTTTTIRMMTAVYFSEYADTYRMNVASLNVGFVFVGAGAILGPWLAWAIDRWWKYRQGLLYFSILLIIPAALTVVCEREGFPKPAAVTATLENVFTHAGMTLLIGVILLYFALENCLEFWPDPYLKELGYSSNSLQVGLLVFWLAFIGARAAAALWFFHHPTHGFVVTLILVIISASVLGNLAGGYEFGSGSLGFWLLGACYGPMIPGFVGIALDLYHEQLPSSVLGGLLALSGVDTLLMRPFMQAIGKDRTARTVMRVPALIALVMAALLLLLAFLR